jgi:1-acyl-sn-glycerol-3-phosphate acyltransferase
MLGKVAAVCGYMFRSMIVYGLRRLFRPAGLDAALEADYRSWARFTLRTFGVDLRVEGAEHIPPRDGRRLVIMANHQSQLDIPALVAALDRRMGFVAKRELGRIPLLAFWMRQIGCVFIDRSDRTGAHRALEVAAREMGAHPLVVFPEGTRSRTGRLLPLKTGGFRLSLLAEARILPILIDGTRYAAEGRDRKASGPVAVRVRIFPALETRSLEDGKASLARLRAQVDACWRSAASPSQLDPVPASAPDSASADARSI